MDDILTEVISHIKGHSKKSHWISASYDLKYVLCEYAITQSGKFNLQKQRKYIAVIEGADEINLNTTNLSHLMFEGKYIDFSNNQLDEYVTKGIIIPKYYKEIDLNCMAKVLNNEINGIKPSVSGFNGYAKTTKEVLFYNDINLNNIKYILSPLIQDIIYNKIYGITDQNIINDIIDKTYQLYNSINFESYNFTNEEKNLIAALYNHNNPLALVDIAGMIYSEDKDIEEIYEILKLIKKNILYKITEEEITYLIDDAIYVTNKQHTQMQLLNDQKKMTKKISMI